MPCNALALCIAAVLLVAWSAAGVASIVDQLAPIHICRIKPQVQGKSCRKRRLATPGGTHAATILLPASHAFCNRHVCRHARMLPHHTLCCYPRRPLAATKPCPFQNDLCVHSRLHGAAPLRPCMQHAPHMLHALQAGHSGYSVPHSCLWCSKAHALQASSCTIPCAHASLTCRLSLGTPVQPQVHRSPPEC